MANKWVYTFKEGNMTMRNLLGGKGETTAEMTEIGLPVPQGFTITTEACTQYYEDGRKINDEIMAQAMEGVAWMEKENGKKFGDLKNPLLVSVRSGARASMPGMMDTILNLGLNDDVVAAMIAGNPDPKFERFVYDSYRRFIQMFSDVVMEVGKKYFEQLIDKMKADRGVKFDVDLTAADLKELAEQFKAEYKNQLGTEFPSDPVEQLKLAIEAVFRSWDNPRANVYRRDNDIPYSWGTAVNVMPMVFGNLNDQSGTGVAFTRDPATGENKLMGEFLINAQGEDVVAGVRTPMPIAQMEQEFPEAYAEFLKVCETLENHYHDMQDMEFTVENMHEEASMSIREQLERDELDFGIIILSGASNRLQLLPMSKNQIVCCVPASSPLAKKKAISMDDVADTKIVMLKEGSFLRQTILGRMKDEGITPNIVLESNQINTLKGLVANGVGITFLLDMVADEMPGLKTLPLADPIFVDVGLAWKKDRYISKAAQSFIDFCKDLLKKNTSLDDTTDAK